MVHILSSDKHIYKFSKDNLPALRVIPGDTVEIQTCDCFSNQIQSIEDNLDGIDWERVNPATGPIYVEGAEVHDILKVTIEKITLNNQGVMASGKDLGVLGDELDGIMAKIISVKDNKAIFNDKITFSLNPMIGVIGTSPAGDAINCGTPGSHGGNMDNTMITEGAVLYLPVFVEGALFALGDLHAAMGDGEIGVTGIETAGSVKVKLELIKGLEIINPILENKESFSTIASAETLDKAVEGATKYMFNLLTNKLPIEKHELAMLMSAVGQAEICQVVDPLRTARFVMPKWLLDKYDFKL